MHIGHLRPLDLVSVCSLDAEQGNDAIVPRPSQVCIVYPTRRYRVPCALVQQQVDNKWDIVRAARQKVEDVSNRCRGARGLGGVIMMEELGR